MSSENKDYAGVVDATDVAITGYSELIKYVSRTRNFPNIRDGLKAVQRRTLYASLAYRDLTKATEIIGDTMKYHPHGDCHRSDTKFYTTSGEVLTIEEMYKRGGEFSTLSIDDQGETALSTLHSVRIGQYTDKVYIIKLSNGGKIECTSNHPLMIEGYTFTKAEDLVVGDKLVGGYITKNKSLVEVNNAVEIVSIEIEEVDQEPMYDFTVDDYHNAMIVNSESEDYYWISVSHNSSVEGTLVTLASKYYSSTPLYDTQGNWGGLTTGAAAARYIECSLSKFGRKIIGSDLMDYAEMDTSGDSKVHPQSLPMYVSYALMEGMTSVTTGMPTPNIPKLNKVELVQYYIDVLSNKTDKTYPSLDEGDVIVHVDNIDDIDNVLRLGQGPAWFVGIIDREGDDSLVISSLTPNRSVEYLVKRVQWYIDKEYIDFSDESSTEYRLVFTVVDQSKITTEELYNILYRALSAKVTYRMLFEDEGVVYESSLDDIVYSNLKYLKECVVRKHEDLIPKSIIQYSSLVTIEALKKDTKSLNKLPKYTSDQLKSAISDILDSISSSIPYELSEDDKSKVISSVVSKPISYLTRSHEEEVSKIKSTIEEYTTYLNNPELYLLPRYEDILSDLVEYSKGKPVSIVATDPGDVSYISRGRIDKDNNLVIKRYGRNNNLYWDIYFWVFNSDGYGYKVYPNARLDTVLTTEDYPEVDSVAGYVSDRDDYVIFIEDNTSISVRSTDDLWDGRDMVNRYESSSLRVVGASGSTYEFKLSDGSTHSINLDEYVRSRKSRTYSIVSKGVTIV